MLCATWRRELGKEPNVTWFTIEAENFESIHNHSAYAYLEGKNEEGTHEEMGYSVCRGAGDDNRVQHYEELVRRDETSVTKSEAPNVAYYSFPDVPIPKELELVRDKSFVYETQNVRTGLLVLSGNVDIDSLEQYFRTNMARTGGGSSTASSTTPSY